MQISRENTSWFLVSGNSEKRHIEDIFYAVWKLTQAGVSKDNIYILDDHPKRDTHYAEIGYKDRVFDISQLKSLVEKISTEFLFLVSTGHGGLEGIPNRSGGFLSPSLLLESLRSNSNLKFGAVVLTQCYAGVFNFVEARPKDKSLELIIMGATNLHNSLSWPKKLEKPFIVNGKKVLDEWSANFYFCSFFEWIQSPSDVDGDNKLTLMDAYKYSGSHSNQKLLQIKVDLEAGREGINNLKVVSDWLLQDFLENKFVVSKARSDALKKKYLELLSILHLHQEPWILNSIPAQDLEFDL